MKIKKTFLIVLAFAAFACSKESEQPAIDSNGESTVVININIDRSQLGSRSIETGHPGADGNSFLPKIVSVTVIPYNEYGVEITQIDLSAEQMKKALWGTGYGPDGIQLPAATPGGTTVGLPVGTQKVDVVVNRPSGVNPSKVTNINYFNYRSDLADKGDNTPGTTDNFERVYLTTEDYGIGKNLGANTSTEGSVPQYKLDFRVSPSMARFEVYGAINVKTQEIWEDGYGSNWRTMSKSDFENQYKASNSLLYNATTGIYTYKKQVAVVGGGMAEAEVTFRNVVAGTADNGFDQTLVYFPEYYWYDVSGVSIRTPLDKNTTKTEDDVDNSADLGAAWIKNTDLNGKGTEVTWLPNMFYAVDVESIFINNIKVRGITNTPYMHPWPGSESANGWLDWYKAYHIGGWHSSGSSAGNTFLCMGNMWDRIATTANPATDEKTITFPSITNPGTGSTDNMNIIIKKAIPDAGKSNYYDVPNNRNLGIADTKASAFQIYAQSTSASADKDQVTTSLPHIIIKVKAYENATKYGAGEYVSGKEFITIKAFKQGGNYVTNFKNANIYRVNLNDLLGTFVGKVPVPGGKPSVDPTDPIDPDPEMPGSQLNINVQILPWIIQNITPEI